MWLPPFLHTTSVLGPAREEIMNLERQKKKADYLRILPSMYLSNELIY